MKIVEMFREKAKLKGRPLAAPLVGYPAIQLSKSSIFDNLNDAKVQVESLLQLYNAFGYDVIMPFMDLSAEAQALGLKTRFHDDQPPEVQEHPVKEEEDLEGLTLPTDFSSTRLNVFAQTISTLKKHFEGDDGAPFIGGYLASPFTLAGLLMGAEDLAVNTLIDPEFVHATVKYATQFTIAYAQFLEKAGADFIVVLEPTAILLSPDSYDTFVREAVEEVAAHLKVPTVLHICGQTTPIMDRLAATKVASLSLDADVDIPSIMHLIPEDKLVVGNISPVTGFLYADAKKITEETDTLQQNMAQYSNFLISSGCDLPVATPLENLEAFAKATKTIAL